MSTLVKLGRSRQVAIPKKMTDRLRLSVGDYLDVEVAGNKLVMTPKAIVDRDPELEADIAASLEDVREGRVYGPFETAAELTRSLHKHARAATAGTSGARRARPVKVAAKRKPSPRRS
jgi:AbrB family looped-hinge helix DNA binding protein